MLLDGKVVLITGASQGIGAACVKAFRAENARLVLNALPDGLLDRFAAQKDTLLCPGDLTDTAVRQKFVDLALERFGRVDVLVNNAGVGLYAPPSTVPIDLARRMFDLNVFVPLALGQLVMPHMRQQRSGAIVNVGSVGGYVSLPWAVMYCASKFALHAVNDSQRRELLRDGVRVSKVCPGIVETDFRDHVLGGVAPPKVADIKRVVTPEQVAGTIVRAAKTGAHTLYVPQIGRAFTALDAISSRVMDWYLMRKDATVSAQKDVAPFR
jgi:NAD(P)-dependent dehydrogenase (short-subunit alcohol dehydrogenase family)